MGGLEPSNAARCPDCDAVMGIPLRKTRLCGTCNHKARTSAVVLTLIPLRYMAAFSQQTYDALRGMAAYKYWLISSIDGVRPEILVAHEMGHQLFLPHAPFGFNYPNGGLNLAFYWRWILRLATPLVRSMSSPVGAEADLHETANTACMMGYDFGQMANLHFCTKCILRLRGWDVTAVRALR